MLARNLWKIRVDTYIKIVIWVFLICHVTINVLINVTRNVTRNDTINLSNTEAEVLNIIDNNDRVKRSDVAKAIDKSEMTVQRAINKLKDNNLIKRIGSNKNGYWITLK